MGSLWRIVLLMYYCAFCFTISRWTNDDHYKCMHFCSVGLNLVFVCLVFFTFCSTARKKNFLIWKMSLFGGLFVFCNDYKKIPFFPLISTDVISDTTELWKLFYISSVPVSFFVFVFFFLSLKQLVLQDLERCIRGRVVTISDLKEVLKAKTEEKDRQKEARRDLIMGRATTFGNVLSDNSQSSTQTKKLKKNSAWDLIPSRIWPRSIPGGV